MLLQQKCFVAYGILYFDFLRDHAAFPELSAPIRHIIKYVKEQTLM